jgi:hypothetical protein
MKKLLAAFVVSALTAGVAIAGGIPALLCWD